MKSVANMSVVFFKNNVQWNELYSDLPVFLKNGTPEYKLNWIIYNYFNNNLDEILNRTLPIEWLHEDENGSQIKIDLSEENVSSLSDLSHYFEMKSNYLGIWDGDKFNRFYFVRRINYDQNLKILTINLKEDYLFNYAKDIYESLEENIWVNRAHINRFKDDTLEFDSIERKTFNWDKNNLLLNRESKLLTYRADKKRSYKLYGVKTTPIVAIYLRDDQALQNNPFLMKNKITLKKYVSNGIEQNYYVLCLPFIKNYSIEGSHDDSATQLKKIIRIFTTSILSMSVVSYFKSDWLIESNRILIDDNNYVYQLDGVNVNFDEIKFGVYNEKTKKNDLIINEFTLSDSKDSELSWRAVSEPKNYQYPVKYIEIEKIGSNIKSIAPEYLLWDDDFSLNFIKYSAELSPLSSIESVVIDKGIYKQDKSIGDSLRVKSNATISSNRNSLEFKSYLNDTIWSTELVPVGENGKHIKNVYTISRNIEMNKIFIPNSLYVSKEGNDVYKSVFYKNKNLINNDKVLNNDKYNFNEEVLTDTKFKYNNDNDSLLYSNLNMKKQHWGFNINIMDSTKLQKEKVSFYYESDGYFVNNYIPKKLAFVGRKNFNFLQISNFRELIIKEKPVNLPTLSESKIGNIIEIFSKGIRLWHQDNDVESNSLLINWLNYCENEESDNTEEYSNLEVGEA